MKKTARGFTLVELLIVIAIIAILAVVAFLVINPIELTRRARDASRLSDIASLQQAITVAVQEATGTADKVLCSDGAGGATGTSCQGKSNVDTRASNGTGWVRVDLSSAKAVAIPTLPIDPANGIDFHYMYCADTGTGGSNADWVILTKLESSQQSPKMTTDGGPQDTLFEAGTKISLSGTGNCTF